MKMECSQGSACGKLVNIDFDIPDQEAVDEGELPCFCIDLDDLLEAYANGEKEFEKTYGIFTADALSVFLEVAYNAEAAETVALWLEGMAQQVRKKPFP